MASPDWRGVFPAVTTKFTEADGLDFDAMGDHLEFQLDAGVDGIVILGSLGENAVLSTAEKLEMMRFFTERIAGRVQLLACIAESGTGEALEMARSGEEAGVDGLMVLPPMRYASDNRETLQYFHDVAGATGLPIMLYNNPVAYETDVTPEDFALLADNPRFVAIKESSEDTRRITEIRRLLGDRYAIFCGVDDLAFECLSLGADGWVAGLAVAFPRETVHLFDLICAGEWSRAMEIYEWFLPLLHLDVGPKFVQQIKLVEEIVGCGSARVRAPRLELGEAERARIWEMVETALANRPKC